MGQLSEIFLLFCNNNVNGVSHPLKMLLSSDISRLPCKWKAFPSPRLVKRILFEGISLRFHDNVMLTKRFFFLCLQCFFF